MWEYFDSQEVGLEAATLQRVRNSSLVKCSCAENITGLKRDTETTDRGPGNWAGMVEERSGSAEGGR